MTKWKSACLMTKLKSTCIMKNESQPISW
jgi:hypothetical protein